MFDGKRWDWEPKGGAPKSYTQNEMDLYYLPIYNSANLRVWLFIYVYFLA